MTGMRQVARRLAAISFLVALLIVPLALSGHHHRAGSGSCATCIVTQHSPAVAVPAVALGAVVLGALPVAAPEPLVVTRAGGSPHVGRAPPFGTIRQSV